MPLDPEKFFCIRDIENLIKYPEKKLNLKIGEHNIHCSIAIPNIADRISRHFSDIADVEATLKDMPFKHFGFIVEFEDEVNLDIYDDDLLLNSHLKYIVSELGVCIFKNIKLDIPAEKKFQKNIFPDLVFHIDRGHHFSNQYSLFYRNPDDPEHRYPRTTTTLIIPNAAAHLQAIRENCVSSKSAINCKFFTGISPKPAIGEYMIEQMWDAPELNGEICLFDNRTVMHASYHRGKYGYQISVQYLY